MNPNCRTCFDGVVFLTSVMEYLNAELLELAGNTATQHHRKQIKPRHIMLSIADDAEFAQVLKHLTISESGVVPQIHLNLLKHKGGDQAKSSKSN